MKKIKFFLQKILWFSGLIEKKRAEAIVKMFQDLLLECFTHFMELKIENLKLKKMLRNRGLSSKFILGELSRTNVDAEVNNLLEKLRKIS